MVRSVLWPCYYCRIWFHCSSVSRKVVLVTHYFLVLSNFQKLWYHPIFPRPYPSLGLYTTVLPSRHQALDYSSRCVHFKDGWPHLLYVDFLRFTVTSQHYFPVPMRHPSFPLFVLIIASHLIKSTNEKLRDLRLITQDTLGIVQETGIKTIPMEKKCKKAEWLSEETLWIAVKRREAKSKGEK